MQYIEFYKQRVTEYKGDRFNFSFRKSSEYETWEDFKNDVKSQGYKMTFSNIPDSYINSLVDEGKLYLFWIYNKDFSPKKAKEGTPNLHTLYWKMLFDENNLKDIVYKLNGDAKIFHRKASLSIDKTTIHKSGTPIALRNPTQEKKENKFNYDIIKDRRFTEDKYFFHVPITINFKATGKDNLNNKVDQFIEQKFDNMHIIGIDRGERHLLYVSIIDTKGNIKEQFSLNTLENNGQNHDFHQKLAKREEDRIQARKNWQAMQGIKDLKTGYLSLVVHEIAKLILERNAIVVMEDLNIGFKNSRLKIEKSVYQKFENMLISKLNFLASKDQTQSNAPGGLLHGYQLTPPMGKVSDIGKRCGFIFYVPAWNTSQIDPVTGFVDLFDTKYSNVENAREFFQKFKDITYDKTDKLFAFEVKNYADFSKKAEDTRQSWVLYSHGERIEQKKNDKGYWVCEPVNLTEAMTRLFEDFNINIEKNLKDQIVKKTEAKFFKQLLWLFRLMVQMRNSEYQSSVEENHTPLDYIISPVKDAKGKFYCSEDYSGNKAELPIDADANGAYNIARKGLMLMQRIKDFKPVKDNDYVSLAISNKEWLNFVQEQDK